MKWPARLLLVASLSPIGNRAAGWTEICCFSTDGNSVGVGPFQRLLQELELQANPVRLHQRGADALQGSWHDEVGSGTTICRLEVLIKCAKGPFSLHSQKKHRFNGWITFEQHLRVDIPPSESIAAFLRQVSLTYPRPPWSIEETYDLRIYRPIHEAWRAKRLRELLTITQGSIFAGTNTIRDSEILQLTLTRALQLRCTTQTRDWVIAADRVAVESMVPSWPN